MITHYPSKSKGPTPINEMHDAHLGNAIAVLEKATGARRDFAMLTALRGERDRRIAAGLTL